jgi:hypothetical protein
MILLIEKYLLFIVTDQIDSPAGTVEPYNNKRNHDTQNIHIDDIKYNFLLVVSSENAQLTMEEPELGY